VGAFLVLLRLFLARFHAAESPATHYMVVQSALLVLALMPTGFLERFVDGVVQWLSPYWEYVSCFICFPVASSFQFSCGFLSLSFSSSFFSFSFSFLIFLLFFPFFYFFSFFVVVVIVVLHYFVAFCWIFGISFVVVMYSH
jgi:hypothetical protein